MPKTLFKEHVHDVKNWSILGDRYAIEIYEVADLQYGDILIPDQGENRRGWACGEIVGVGNGHRLETDVTVPMFYGVGDVVVFERLTGKDFFIGGKEVRILSQIDVLAKIPRA